MKTNKMKIWIGCGIVCVLSVLLSLWYAITFNHSRLVVPMDFKNYVFEIRDLPMIVSVSLSCIYLVALFVMLSILAFFLFFGFFGFYYEGKMSGTFMDERFRENIARAKLKAYKITFGVMLIALIILCQGKLFGNLEYTLIASIITLSLALALGIFLSEYLLYRYDHDDQAEEGEE